MPNRIVRDAILSSERVCSLGWAEEVFYRRLMSIVDDYGRVEASHQLLRSRCYPLQTDSVRAADISRWMAACQKAGVILCYEVSGKQYLEVLNFGQQLRSASKCPQPPASDSKCLQSPAVAQLVVSVSEGVVGTPQAAQDPKGTRLPKDWVLPVDWQEWAEGERPDLDATVVACGFRDYWIGIPGAKGRKADWEATWRNWVRSQKQGTGGPKKSEHFV